MTVSKDPLSVDDRENAVRVSILGQEYPIRADADEEYIREVASYLNERMNAVHAAEPTRPLSKVAILTALNLTHELLDMKRQNEEMLGEIERRTKEFSDCLDQGLSDS
ncbi:cell division protein ZapA [bacterium]|nr:cell division protein ZapA [bacterium]MBU1636893.1 cell division protein ZapA [bacterium]MBU1921143.1 cell division protein ZapA [bacterium]